MCDMMVRFLNYTRSMINKYREVLVATIAFGILAHGDIMFNRYFFHDEPFACFATGITYEGGRWAYSLLARAFREIFGILISIPIVHMAISMICVAFCAILIIDLLGINGRFARICVAGIMITNVMITCLFFYMLCSIYYMFGYALATLAVYIYIKNTKVSTFLIASICAAFAVGIYQAVIPYILSILVTIFILHVYERKNIEWKDYIKYMLLIIAFVTAFTFIYLVVMKMSLIVLHLDLTSYKGINNVFGVAAKEYLNRLVYAYKEFFVCSDKIGNNSFVEAKTIEFDSMFPKRIRWMAILSVVFLCSSFLSMLLCFIKKKEYKQLIQFIIPALVFPVSVNLMYVMAESETIYSLMQYSQVFVWIMVVKIVDVIMENSNGKGVGLERNYSIRRYAAMFIFAVVWAVNVAYIVYDNVYYYKANLIQERTVSYYNTLITKIKSIDGYKDEYPVVVINEKQIVDKSVSEISELETFNVAPISTTMNNLNCYSWRSFIDRYCGYRPVYLDEKNYKGNREIEAMPSYPDDGSIQVMNDIVVIKFGE